jgi:putative copper resistance protein D
VPRPADLRVHMAPGIHTDGELFYWISYGYPGSAMPAWKDVLTEEQRWDVMNYARTLNDQTTGAAQPPS